MDRRLRLRNEWEINETRRRGTVFAQGPLVARILKQTSDQPANRYAVIAGKRVGGAVQRNRCKRLVREALRTLHPMLEQGYDVVAIVRGTPDELQSMQNTLDILTRIMSRAQLLVPQAATNPFPDELPERSQ
ncbi:ribonuclease P protein component [soil metagenome]